MASTTVIGLGQGLSLNNAVEGFDLLTTGSGTWIPDYDNQKCLVFVVGGGGGATGEGASSTSGSSGTNTTFGDITALGGITTGAVVNTHWYCTQGDSKYQIPGQPVASSYNMERSLPIPFGNFGAGGFPGYGSTPVGATGPSGELKVQTIDVPIAGLAYSIGIGGAGGTGTFTNAGSQPGMDGAVFIYKIKPYSS